MKYTCPVCGFPDLDDPPANHEICRCCGTQFGYDDCQTSHDTLRQEWISGGAKWFLTGYEPAGWNADLQLRKAGLQSVQTKTQRTVIEVRLNQNFPRYAKANIGRMKVPDGWIAVGIKATSIGRSTKRTYAKTSLLPSV